MDVVSLIPYLIVGAAATAAHWALLALLVEGFAAAPGWASGLGALLGAGIAYAGNRRFTFVASSASHRSALPRFLLVAAGAALANAAIVQIGSDAGLYYLGAQALATTTVVLGSYGVNRQWTFR
jgi:putative flippase GtrA